MMSESKKNTPAITTAHEKTNTYLYYVTGPSDKEKVAGSFGPIAYLTNVKKLINLLTNDKYRNCKNMNYDRFKDAVREDGYVIYRLER